MPNTVPFVTSANVTPDAPLDVDFRKSEASNALGKTFAETGRVENRGDVPVKLLVYPSNGKPPLDYVLAHREIRSWDYPVTRVTVQAFPYGVNSNSMGSYVTVEARSA